jgi:hypothetical protein
MGHCRAPAQGQWGASLPGESRHHYDVWQSRKTCNHTTSILQTSWPSVLYNYCLYDHIYHIWSLNPCKVASMDEKAKIKLFDWVTKWQVLDRNPGLTHALIWQGKLGFRDRKRPGNWWSTSHPKCFHLCPQKFQAETNRIPWLPVHLSSFKYVSKGPARGITCIGGFPTFSHIFDSLTTKFIVVMGTWGQMFWNYYYGRL